MDGAVPILRTEIHALKKFFISHWAKNRVDSYECVSLRHLLSDPPILHKAELNEVH